MGKNETTYNDVWFKKRAFESLRKICPNKWDYSDSLLLYISTGVEKYESLQQTDAPYNKLVTRPEREYLASIAKGVADALPSNFEYIDLGPGTEHKEQFFFDELKKQGKTFTYIPVDISHHYLSLAEKHALGQGIAVRAIQSSFEQLPELLGKATLPRFVNLGLTFSNYEPQEILKLLKDIAGEHGYVFINAQMRDRLDMAALENVYAVDALTLADEKLKLLGLDPNIDVSTRVADQGIKVWCSVINTNEELKEKGINVNDELLVFQSLRYTKALLVDELKKSSKDYQMFDTETSFIATLIKMI